LLDSVSERKENLAPDSTARSLFLMHCSGHTPLDQSEAFFVAGLESGLQDGDLKLVKHGFVK